MIRKRTVLSVGFICMAAPALAHGHLEPGAELDIALANPAATYCIDSGGRYEIHRSSAGEAGICILPDGAKVDAWEYFRAQKS